MTIEIIFYTQLASIIGFIITLFLLYRLLVSQKDAAIELLKERLAAEQSKVTALNNQTPDALVLSLNNRVTVMTQELLRLRNDGDAIFFL